MRINVASFFIHREDVKSIGESKKRHDLDGAVSLMTESTPLYQLMSLTLWHEVFCRVKC